MLRFMGAAAASLSVLIIEEHPFQRRALARRLNELGVPPVLEAAGGTDALELVRANADSIALILSSVDVPQRDGLELLRGLAVEAPQTAVAVLSMLDRASLRTIESKAAEYGLHLIGLLEKPVTDDALRAVLVRALAGRRRSRQVSATSSRSLCPAPPNQAPPMVLVWSNDGLKKD